MKNPLRINPSKRDLEVAASAVMGTASYVHYLQLFILKASAPTLIAGIVFGTIYLAIAVGLAKSIKIFYPLGIVLPFFGASLAILRLRLYGFEVFSVINIGFDVFVISICTYLFVKRKKNNV